MTVPSRLANAICGPVLLCSVFSIILQIKLKLKVEVEVEVPVQPDEGFRARFFEQDVQREVCTSPQMIRQDRK